MRNDDEVRITHTRGCKLLNLPSRNCEFAFNYLQNMHL